MKGCISDAVAVGGITGGTGLTVYRRVVTAGGGVTFVIGAQIPVVTGLDLI